MARREQLRGEGGVAHPTVAVAEARVAGVRAWAAAWFQCMGELVRGSVGLAVAPGARRRLKIERRRTVAARATTMADGGARVRRLA